MALLCIDTQKNRVRRYDWRRLGGVIRCTDELQIVRPQVDGLGQLLNALLAGHDINYATGDAPPPRRAA